MARIEVDPDQVTEVGRALVRLGDRAGDVGEDLRRRSCIGQPPRTGAALGSLEAAWGSASRELQSELSTLGQAALAAGFLYRRTDEDVIPVSAP
jgi:hypothetical protein